MEIMVHRGLLVAVSGPSGTGKGTVIKALREKNNNITLLPSATTRSPRYGEKDGVNYYFKSRDEFLKMIKNGEFVEWVEYCGNLYGTPAKQLNESLEMGLDVVLEKEVDGVLKIKKAYPDSVSVFILPPSFDELKRRIQGRGTETAEAIQKRLDRALEEMKYAVDYDYIVVNDFIESASNAVNCIINAEKLRTKRNCDIIKLIISE